MRHTFAVALLLIVPSIAVATSITVYSDGVMGKLDLYRLNDDEYVSVDVLARLLGGGLEWNSRLHIGTVTLPGHSLVLIPDNPFVSIDGALISIPITPQYRGGRLMVSISTVPLVFSKGTERRIKWDSELRVLTIGEGVPNVEQIRISSSSSETRVVVDMRAPLQFTARPVAQDRYEIFFDRGHLRSSDISATECKGFVRSVHGVNVTNGARVVFRLSKKNVDAKPLLLKNPDRLLITFTPGKKEIAREKFALKVIVIDPGHGGKDPGAIGRGGLQEKIVTLDIAKRLADLLKKKLGVKVVLTRTDDVFVSLKERTDIANRERADLFVSIHCNAARNSKSGGTETYFLSDAKTDWARAVEARENAVLKFELPEGAKDTVSLEFILWDMAQKEFLNESSELAEFVHEELTGAFSVEDRGLKQANFYVLRGCYMPAILVEVAFLSNRREEKLLRKKSFRQKAAEGIYKGLKEFKKVYERKLNL